MEHQVNELADAIIRKMKEEHHVFWVDPETHAAQHGFLALLMQEREEKLARRKRIQEKIAGSLILSAIVTAVTLLGAGALDFLRQHLK